MAKIEVDGYPGFEVDDETRLISALLDHGIDILHRCGGHARCTTCRVAFHEGEPARMTVAERDKLTEKDLLGEVRLSCQIACEGSMKLRPVMQLAGSEMSDAGPEPETTITPAPVWIEKPE